MAEKFDMTITPDLQTRESVMLAAGRVQFAVTDQATGFTTYVKIECKRKGQPGEKNYIAVPLDEATHVFMSEKGYGTSRLGTYYPPREGYGTGRFFTDLAENHPHIIAIRQIIQRVEGMDVGLGWTITAEDQCGLCGRKLEDPESVKRGIGPECAGKPTGTKILHAYERGQQQFDADPEREPTVGEIAAEQALISGGPLAMRKVRAGQDPALNGIGSKQESGDEQFQQIQQIRDEVDQLLAERGKIDERIAQLEAQEAALKDEVPF